MSKKDIQQLDLDQLAHLFHVATDGGTESNPKDSESASAVPGKTEQKLKAFASTQSLGTSVEHPGSWVGPYRLVSALGEGGMGIVYLADQTAPIRRRVALKVIKPGMDSARVVARFEAERQALALLDHPNIAQVHSAGTTENHRPYFVMEYVKGLPITAYCDHHRLCIEARLRLYQQVCHGVQHAHQKGIIHRDIKPSNILVSTENDQPVPKIIDFGVAKAISQPLTERTLFTEDSQLIGTPEYMSPEQADMANEDIDTRSDIYSLGVLLYELVTGVLPFDTATLREGGLDHLRKVIRETDPKTPSTRLTKLGDRAEKLAESRCTEVMTLAKRLHQELEWIPLKAMRKNRVERYRSPSELAEDIENYLNSAPLIAGPPTTLYRLKKFVRRNSVLSTAVLAIAASLILGLAATTAMYLRAERAAQDAIRAAGQEAAARAESEAISYFIVWDVLQAVRDLKARDATTGDFLDVVSQKLEDKFENQPVFEADVRWQLGMTYRGFSDYQAAITHLTRSYELRRDNFGEPNQPTAYTKNYLAMTHNFAGQYSEAERLFDELIDVIDPENVSGLPGHKCNLAGVYLNQGRYKKAERLLLDMLKMGVEMEIPWWKSWPKPPNGFPYRAGLGSVYLQQGRYEEAEQQFNQFLADEGDTALSGMSVLGYVYMAPGRYKEAMDLFTRGLEYCIRELPGKDHKATLAYMNGLAVLHTKQEHYSEAESLFSEVLTARQRMLGKDHPRTLKTVHDLGILRREQGQHEEAAKLLTQARNGRQLKLGPDHPDTLASMHELALLHIAEEDYVKAAPLLLDAYNGRETKLGPEHPHTIDSLNQLVQLYNSWKKPDEAQIWRTKLSKIEHTTK